MITANMTKISRSGKGQIFSIDVLFSLLPIMMIIGASLQYLYLAEEDAKVIVQNSRLETISQGMSGYVMSNILASATSGDYDSFPSSSGCADFVSLLDKYESTFLPSDPPLDYAFYVKAMNYHNTSATLCSGDTLWSSGSLSSWGVYILDEMNNTASSDLRFTNVLNSTGGIDPGKIAGLSFVVWEDIS